MAFLGFSFGKKRKVSKKTSKKVAKPPAKLLRLCKKYRVKATKKVGSKRVYKKVSALKKLCLRKARALRKKLMKMHKKQMKHHKKTHRRRVSKTHRRRGDAFGEDAEMEFGRRRRNAFDEEPEMMFGRRRRVSGFGNQELMGMPMFGKKRRGGAKVSKKAAMKAFRSFYKRHCAGRRSGFGNGGNPPLNQSMGYEFCPNGMGGVLGFNSTGLFPSPCTAYSSSAPMMAALPPPTKVSQGGFGYRKRRSTAAGHKKRRTHMKRAMTKKRTYAVGAAKKRCYAIGSRKRRSTRRRV